MGDCMSEYLCMGPHVWARANTADTALRQARRHHGSGMKSWVIFKFPDGAKPYVDQLGGVGWTNDPEKGINIQAPLPASMVVEKVITKDFRKERYSS
jgi:hypothetical protein